MFYRANEFKEDLTQWLVFSDDTSSSDRREDSGVECTPLHSASLIAVYRFLLFIIINCDKCCLMIDTLLTNLPKIGVCFYCESSAKFHSLILWRLQGSHISHRRQC